MKIIFNSRALMSLPDYGIQIPMTDGRILKIFDFLNKKNVPIISDYLNSVELTREDLARAHRQEYLDQLFGSQEERREAVARAFELINTDGSYNRYHPTHETLNLEVLVEQVLMQVKGTMVAVLEALRSGESYYLGGGYHHAMSFGGRGFCLLNDVVITARWLQHSKKARLIWIIDVDAHKGDGTAEITQGDSSIRTLSIHMAQGWPLDSGNKDDPWFMSSDVEIPIPQNAEGIYLSSLKEGLLRLESLDSYKPDLALVVQGSDPYEKDELPSSGHLKLSQEQMLERDLLVYRFLAERNIPQAYVMAGGYGDYAYEVYQNFLEQVL